MKLNNLNSLLIPWSSVLSALLLVIGFTGQGRAQSASSDPIDVAFVRTLVERMTKGARHAGLPSSPPRESARGAALIIKCQQP